MDVSGHVGGGEAHPDVLLEAIETAARADGSVATYVADGTFRDAGASTIDARGAFTVAMAAGARLA